MDHETKSKTVIVMGSEYKPIEELFSALRKGSLLQKYGRRGTPKYHHFALSLDYKYLQWQSQNGRIRQIPMAGVVRVQPGQTTAIFKRYPQPHLSQLSMSIIYQEESSHERSLDVICANASDYQTWFYGTALVAQWHRTNSAAAVSASRSGEGLDGSTYRSLASSMNSQVATDSSLEEIQPKNAKPARTASAFTVGSTSLGGRMPTILASSGPRELGDLYAWGTLMTGDVAVTHPRFKNAKSHDAHPVVQQNAYGAEASVATGTRKSANARPGEVVFSDSGLPLPLASAVQLDVARAACGPRHAVILTRGGEVYTWGYGRTGLLGHGTELSTPTPKRISALFNQGVRQVAASDGACAAITSEGQLWTWGCGNAGQLGRGEPMGSASPRRLSFGFSGMRVSSVACGPYHTAAVGEDGSLWTWGSGMFGRLGHGSYANELKPRKVMGLAATHVTSVACGWWHTAAVATARSSNIILSASAPANLSDMLSLPLPTSAVNLLSQSSPSPFFVNATSALGPGDVPEVAPAGMRSLASKDSLDIPIVQAPLDVPLLISSASIRASQEAPAQIADPSPWAYGVGSPNSTLVTSLVSAPLMATVAEDTMEGFEDLQADGSADSSSPSPYQHSKSPSPKGTRERERTLRPYYSTSNAIVPELDLPDRSSNTHGHAGGMLFTWGSCFTWAEPGDPAQARLAKRDHHGGCLGSGDLEGRMVPTRVMGELEKQSVVKVAVGVSMTVALTSSGRVYQMGRTGAENSTERDAAWEGSTVPALVEGNMFGMFAEEISCGAAHVAAVASRVSPSGVMVDDLRRMRLLVWGKGTAGQLGLGEVSPRDHKLPQVVAALDGRRVLSVECGVSCTFAVCQHDSREHLTQMSTPSSASGLFSNGPSTSSGGHSKLHHNFNRGHHGFNSPSSRSNGRDSSSSSEALKAKAQTVSLHHRRMSIPYNVITSAAAALLPQATAVASSIPIASRWIKKKRTMVSLPHVQLNPFEQRERKSSDRTSVSMELTESMLAQGGVRPGQLVTSKSTPTMSPFPSSNPAASSPSPASSFSGTTQNSMSEKGPYTGALIIDMPEGEGKSLDANQQDFPGRQFTSASGGISIGGRLYPTVLDVDMELAPPIPSISPHLPSGADPPNFAAMLNGSEMTPEPSSYAVGQHHSLGSTSQLTAEPSFGANVATASETVWRGQDLSPGPSHSESAFPTSTSRASSRPGKRHSNEATSRLVTEASLSAFGGGVNESLPSSQDFIPFPSHHGKALPLPVTRTSSRPQPPSFAGSWHDASITPGVISETMQNTGTGAHAEQTREGSFLGFGTVPSVSSHSRTPSRSSRASKHASSDNADPPGNYFVTSSPHHSRKSSRSTHPSSENADGGIGFSSSAIHHSRKSSRSTHPSSENLDGGGGLGPPGIPPPRKASRSAFPPNEGPESQSYSILNTVFRPSNASSRSGRYNKRVKHPSSENLEMRDWVPLTAYKASQRSQRTPPSTGGQSAVESPQNTEPLPQIRPLLVSHPSLVKTIVSVQSPRGQTLQGNAAVGLPPKQLTQGGEGVRQPVVQPFVLSKAPESATAANDPAFTQLQEENKTLKKRLAEIERALAAATAGSSTPLVISNSPMSQVFYTPSPSTASSTPTTHSSWLTPSNIPSPVHPGRPGHSAEQAGSSGGTSGVPAISPVPVHNEAAQRTMTAWRGHRRSVSLDAAVDVSRNTTVGENSWSTVRRVRTATVEYGQGVYLTIEPRAHGLPEVRRVRFSRSLFSTAAAQEWWRTHLAEMSQHFNISTLRPLDTMMHSRSSSHVGVASHTSPARGDPGIPPLVLRGALRSEESWYSTVEPCTAEDGGSSNNVLVQEP